MNQKHTLIEFDFTQAPENIFELLRKDWGLLTAGTQTDWNTMTVSWGGFGFKWQKPVAYAFVRPQRYTLSFMEKNDGYTLTFLDMDDTKSREILSFCGSKSGRDTNKAIETGLVPLEIEPGYTTFESARLVLLCRKLHVQNLDPAGFTDQAIAQQWYPQNDFHRIFTGEIIKAYKAE